MYHGLINIYKEKGYTSHDVVAILRGVLKQKKIGHTGTLDPQAEGVLPVCLGKGTKLCDMLTEKDKVYQVVLRLGIETDTEDMTGTVLKESDTSGLEESKVREVIHGFIGKQLQIPPMYSAIKVNGKKLYQLAREGIVIERQGREIEVYRIEIIGMELPYVTMEIECSKGTYIRSICRDIGKKLSVGGAMQELVRTRVSSFYIKDSLKIEQVKELLEKGTLGTYISPVDTPFLGFPQVVIDEKYDKWLLNGNKLNSNWFSLQPTDSLVRVYDARNEFIGLYEWEKENLKPYKLFLG